MSVENVKAFFARVGKDKALREEYESMLRRMREATFAEVVKIGSAAGFEFTVADLVEARKAALGALSDEELKNVAGGHWDWRSTVLP